MDILPNIKPIKILIIAAYSDNYQTINKYLSSSEYSHINAENLEQALSIIDADTDSIPDLILIAVNHSEINIS